jgi:ubiquitin C-terminal hydrolase
MSEYCERYQQPIILKDKVLIIPPLGFQNTGSICYFNSLVQCLLSSKSFLNYSLYLENDYNLFKTFIDNIIDDKWDSVFTTRLLQKCDMTNPNQSSSEYFIRLLDLLKLESLFESKHNISITCTQCGNRTEKVDISYNLLINENFNEFFDFSEKIDNFNCEKCNQKTTVEHHKELFSLSSIVVLCLNKYFGKKMIEYPETFKLQDFEYKIIGTIEHIGNLNGGHYISRFHRNSNTYIGDDSKIMKIEENIFRPVIETYMVFYERVR